MNQEFFMKSKNTLKPFYSFVAFVLPKTKKKFPQSVVKKVKRPDNFKTG